MSILLPELSVHRVGISALLHVQQWFLACLHFLNKSSWTLEEDLSSTSISLLHMILEFAFF